MTRIRHTARIGRRFAWNTSITRFLFQNETGYSCDKVKFCEEVSTILRVKDPLAAVWPFLGIVAEVSYQHRYSPFFFKYRYGTGIFKSSVGTGNYQALLEVLHRYKYNV